MLAGHFGLAAAVRSKVPEVPLWALMVGTQLLDLAFVPLLLSGMETMDEAVHGGGYGNLIIHADYSHSLVAALLLSLLAGLAGRRLWGARAGKILSGVVFSHWILDVVVHRADMVLLPGNWGGLPLLGLGVWKFTWLAILLELLLILVGIIMYSRSALKTAAAGRGRRAALLSSVVLGTALMVTLISDVTGLF
ncbi:permease [Paenibacillus sp. Z3-2]